MQPRILYVEDDPNLSFVTKDNLELNHYEIVHCPDGQLAWGAFQAQHFDACVLDVMLPLVDGFTLAKQIRAINPDVPILFLTARSLQEDKIQGLRLGGDDYLTKPFSMEELILRIEVFLRRSRTEQSVSSSQTASTLAIGTYTFNFYKLQLLYKGSVQNLTFREAEVLRYLAERPDQIVRREELLKAIWGDDDYFMGRSLDVFISRLRKYLSQDPTLKIEGIHGVGFRLRC
ncbi:MAG: DNA-binding response regulator [Runella slithyformis]|nr:MAG: DNA-binding response regulator [Runella sp.]TAG22951.1 MAG: DNA-binding response regulator [Cytophagales bacterium]TAG42006.1 MAG: DNA-binding response regulator [Cytophagia bacterium]TAG51911.1 MAG: DNA-binding response regulator [Runella slithyformis]TAG64746.1 MAG: DNA-binding response regulator [Runella slithyformis]